MKKIPFIKYYKIWLFIAACTVVASIACIVIFGLKPGIDFTNGTLLQISFSKDRPDNELVRKVFEEKLAIKEPAIQRIAERDIMIRSGVLTPDQQRQIVEELKNRFGSNENEVREVQSETVGPVISQQLRTRAIWAIVLISLGIVAYLAYAFRKVSRPVASWKYGLMAVVAMLHDILLVLGVFALLGHFKGVEIDIPFVVALLTVLGFSVNDTIVVYDRIRENLTRHSADNFSEVVNNGLNETLARSINTTLTVLIPLFILYFIGGTTLHNFTLALLIGMASGAYSSIFVASPLLVLAVSKKK
jgi:preprotein translocase subunit SecF